MKTLLALVTVCLIVSLSSLTLPVKAYNIEAQTQVNGAVNSSTTWSKTNSPYILTSSVIISLSATLTVEPGVQVNLNGNYLRADGILIAQGGADEKVYLSGGLVILNSDSIIENAVLSNTLQITVNSSSPSITQSLIDSRITVTGGSPIISNNTISDGIHVDAIGGPVTIANNKITSKSGFQAIYIQGVHADIVGNIIVGNNNMGVQIYHVISTASIRNNQICNSSYGIHTFTGTPSKISILENAIFNNTIGINNRSNMTLQDNTVAFNEIGLQCAHLNTIRNNNFYNNSRFNLENDHIVDFEVSGNWWGTTDTELISQSIFDKKNDIYRGQVDFQPFLTVPNSKAPAIPVEALMTPTPTVPPKEPVVDNYLFLGLAAIFIAIAIVGALILLALKKRQ